MKKLLLLTLITFSGKTIQLSAYTESTSQSFTYYSTKLLPIPTVLFASAMLGNNLGKSSQKNNPINPSTITFRSRLSCIIGTASMFGCGYAAKTNNLELGLFSVGIFGLCAGFYRGQSCKNRHKKTEYTLIEPNITTTSSNGVTPAAPNEVRPASPYVTPNHEGNKHFVTR